MIQICVFKKKKKEGGEGRPPTWWLMKGSKIGGPWNVPCLEVHGETSLFGA